MSKLIRIRIVEFLVEFLEKYLFYGHFPKFLKLSIFHVISHFVIEIRVHWQKLNQERASEINIWTHKSKYLKSNDFERKKSITTHAIFWCQKLPKSNLYLILFFVFWFFHKKSHLLNIFSRSTQKYKRTEPHNSKKYLAELIFELNFFLAKH